MRLRKGEKIPIEEKCEERKRQKCIMRLRKVERIRLEENMKEEKKKVYYEAKER